MSTPPRLFFFLSFRSWSRWRWYDLPLDSRMAIGRSRLMLAQRISAQLVSGTAMKHADDAPDVPPDWTGRSNHQRREVQLAACSLGSMMLPRIIWVEMVITATKITRPQWGGNWIKAITTVNAVTMIEPMDGMKLKDKRQNSVEHRHVHAGDQRGQVEHQTGEES
jgi:hypothetical protein